MAEQQIIYKNMHPTAEERTHAASVVQGLLDSAPYDARALALMEKLEDGYRFSIDIYSKFGPFIAETVAQDPVRALDDLVGEIRPRLSRNLA